MVYGGRIGSLANPDVIWAGIGNQVVYREHLGDPLQAVSGYHGDYVQTIVADPQNYRHIIVVDGSSQVWTSFDAGHTFLNITANLAQLTPFVTTIELVSTGAAPQDKMLVAGGLNGVFAIGPNSTWAQPWYRLGDNLPHVLVQDLHYDANANLLLVGTLGRGAWTLSDPLGAGNAVSGQLLAGTVAVFAVPATAPGVTLGATAVPSPTVAGLPGSLTGTADIPSGNPASQQQGPIAIPSAGPTPTRLSDHLSISVHQDRHTWIESTRPKSTVPTATALDAVFASPIGDDEFSPV
jgi:hypothetical protein